jgi:phosphoglycerol transferase MdoB-like AlkP superfamily enzyme
MKLSLRHYYRRWLKNIFLLFVFSALLLTVARLGFVSHFGSWQSLKGDPGDFFRALFLGLRYDLIPLSYIFAPPFLFLHFVYLLKGRIVVKITRVSLISFLTMGHFLLLWLYVFDYGFYSYFQDHLNILFFGLFEDDTVATLISIWKNYNIPLWLSFVFAIHYAIYRIIKLMFSMFDFDLRGSALKWKLPVIFISGVLVLTFFGRGSFGRLPLSLEDAHISRNEFINELSLNGVITLNRAIKIRKTFGKGNFNYLKKYGFSSWEEAFEAAFNEKREDLTLLDSLTDKSTVKEIVKQRPPHVVLVIMESFGSYWIDQNRSDFQILGELDRHFKEGILFKNFLSAENGTIGSVMSVATSSVIRPGARFLSESEFMRLPLSSAGNLPFKMAGYDTHFVYGGKLGWRDLGKYLSHQKYDHLWGADEIKESLPELVNVPERELGNEWGIFDEYLYSFIEDQLRTAMKPQLFLVLTTSNHPPFEFPSAYKPLPLTLSQEFMSRMTTSQDLTEKRFLGMQYANQKMGEFISRARNSALKDSMIISLTGDHSFWIANEVGLDQEFKRYAVPFFISTPDAYKPLSIDHEKFGSHEDIFPTLFHLALSGQRYTRLGENMFTDDSHAMNSSGLVASKAGAYHNGKFWKWKDRERQLLEETETTPELLKLKQHSLGLISITDLYLKEENSRKRSGGASDRP